LNRVASIRKGLNYYMDLNGKLSITYILHLEINYSFGHKIYLKYDAKDYLKDHEPDEIKYIRLIIE